MNNLKKQLLVLDLVSLSIQFGQKYQKCEFEEVFELVEQLKLDIAKLLKVKLD